MPKVRDLADCPLCFGRLLPLSVCQSCNTVMVRDGLEDIGPQIACEDCGATNPTHFVCSACNARFPYGEIVKPEGPTCPVCKSPVPVGAGLCPHCSAVLPVAGVAAARSIRRIRGEFTDEDVREVSRIPGVGPARAQALCAAGYNALWKISQCSEGDLAKVKGIGPKVAAEIKEALRFLLLIGRRKTKEEVLSEECDCPLCGTVTSLFASTCHGCGAAFDEEELDDEFRKEVVQEEDKGLLAYYDVRLLETPNSGGLLFARGLLLLAMGRGSDALASLDRVLEIEPTNSRALQAKTRALASAKGIGSAAQVLRDVVSGIQPSTAAPEALLPQAQEEEALRALTGLEEVECPECGERQAPGSRVCPVCGHRFGREEPEPVVAPGSGLEERLLEDLERAVAGETKAPPPPLRPEVPDTVVDRKRAMLAFLLGVPGVGRRAAEAVSGFFQDADQIRLSEIADLADIPGVAPAEARIIKEAVDERFGPVPEEEPAPPVPPPVTSPPPRPERPLPRAREETPEEIRWEPAPRPAAAHPLPAAPRPRAAEITAGRRGLINGRGLVNGRGRVNGLINGSGFVNGSSVAEPRLPKRNLMPRYVAIGAAMLMLFVVASAVIPATPPGGLRVDGSFADWQGATEYSFPTTSSNPNVRISAVFLSEDSVLPYLFLRVRVGVGGIIFDGNATPDTLYAFLDTDGVASTGYAVSGLGADYMVQVSGFDRKAQETRLSQFMSADQENWSAWKFIVAVPAQAGQEPNGRWDVEASVAEDLLGPSFKFSNVRAAFAFDDNADQATHTDVPVNGQSASLRVTQDRLAGNLTSVGQPFLRLTLEAIGGSVDVRSISIETTSGAVLGPPPQMPLTIDPASPQSPVWTIDARALPSNSVVSARVLSVDTTAPYVVLNPPARGYVNSPPVGKRIDGLFFDWAGSSDIGSPAVRRDSLHITSRNGTVVGSDAYLYMRLGGAAFEGAPEPQRLSRPAQSSGSGGSSGVGTPPPRNVGYDYVRFYLQTNSSVSGGVNVNGLVVDRYVEVRGREHQVTNASLYRWSGSIWRWEGPAAWGLGPREVEVSATTPGAAIGVTRLVAVTSDWRGIADVAGEIPTRSGTRGGDPRVEPLHGSAPQTIAATPLTNTPTIDGNCATSGSEYDGASSDGVSNMSFKIGRRSDTQFVYVCVDVTGDTSSNALDWGELVFDTNHLGGTAPQSDDRRFRVNSGSGALDLTQKGNGTTWITCDSSCDGGDTATGAFTGGHEVYEFKIRFSDVWGTNSPGANQRAGFAVLAHDEGGSNYAWGNTGVDDAVPNTWGHLDIAEFPHVVAVALVAVAPFALIRRRRLRSG